METLVYFKHKGVAYKAVIYFYHTVNYHLKSNLNHRYCAKQHFVNNSFYYIPKKLFRSLCVESKRSIDFILHGVKESSFILHGGTFTVELLSLGGQRHINITRNATGPKSGQKDCRKF